MIVPRSVAAGSSGYHRVVRRAQAKLFASSLLLAAASVLACGGADVPDALVSNIAPGLHVRGSASLSPDDHMLELAVHAGHVYVANSWSGLGVMRLDDDGALTVTDVGETEFGVLRCTSLAIHEPSNTLYCAADSPPAGEPPTQVIQIFDLSEPGTPVRGEPFPIMNWSVRDLVVRGDQLLIHQFDDGLWTAAIAADGALSQLEHVGEVAGNVRTSVVVDGRLVVALADPQGRGTQLRLYAPDSWTEQASLALDGPPLGISADASGLARVAVGLGSAGMAIVELRDDALVLERTLHPQSVVTHGLIADRLAIAMTYAGAFAWTLDDAGDDAKLFGFGAEGSQGEKRNGNMLHGVLHDGELIASDWTWVERWAIDPAGDIVALDVPRGVYVQPDGPIVTRLRNFGPLQLRAEFWYRRDHLFDIDIAPEAVTRVAFPASIRTLLDDDPVLRLGIRVFDPTIGSSGEPLSTSQFVIVERPADEPLPPAVGDTFPIVTFDGPDGLPFTLPLDEGTQTVWFTIDCALMWAEVEDRAWLSRAGLDTERGPAVVLSDTNLVLDGFARRHSLDGLLLGYWGLAASPETRAANSAYAEELYESFWVPELPGDAVIMDYTLGPDGQVRSIERMYRGLWPLVEPWPWD